jgi:hypothetical protein
MLDPVGRAAASIRRARLADTSPAKPFPLRLGQLASGVVGRPGSIGRSVAETASRARLLVSWWRSPTGAYMTRPRHPTLKAGCHQKIVAEVTKGRDCGWITGYSEVTCLLTKTSHYSSNPDLRLCGNHVLPAQPTLPKTCPKHLRLRSPAQKGFPTHSSDAGLSVYIFQKRPPRLLQMHLTFRRLHPAFWLFQNHLVLEVPFRTADDPPGISGLSLDQPTLTPFFASTVRNIRPYSITTLRRSLAYSRSALSG